MNRALAGLTVCVALWGMVFVAIHELLPLIDPVPMVTLRFLLTSALFAVLLAARPAWRPRFTRRQWALCLAAGVLAVPATQLAAVEGQRYLSPTIAALIVTTTPAIAAVLGVAFLNERLSARNVIGFAIAFAGVALIVVLGAGTGADAGASDPLGAAVIVLSALGWASYTLLSKPLSADTHAVTAAGAAVIAGTFSLAPAIPAALGAAAEIPAPAWGWLLYLAVGGTFVPYLLWSISLRRLDVSRTASFMYFVPVFAAVWSFLVLGNALTAVTILGGAIVFSGVVLVQRGHA